MCSYLRRSITDHWPRVYPALRIRMYLSLWKQFVSLPVGCIDWPLELSTVCLLPTVFTSRVSSLRYFMVSLPYFLHGFWPNLLTLSADTNTLLTLSLDKRFWFPKSDTYFSGLQHRQASGCNRRAYRTAKTFLIKTFARVVVIITYIVQWSARLVNGKIKNYAVRRSGNRRARLRYEP